MGKLTADAIVDRALRVGDAEGLDAVTIRRLAADLGVTPMALYWHFKNKDQLLAGMADHLIAGFAPGEPGDRSWRQRLREVMTGLIRVLRAHPCAKSVLEQVDQMTVPNFLAVWDEALGLARSAGFTVEESCLITKYLLQSAISIADAPVHFTAACDSPEVVAEFVRVKRLGLESLPAATYPNLVEMAGPMIEVSPGLYDTFGVDLVLAGIEALADRR